MTREVSSKALAQLACRLAHSRQVHRHTVAKNAREGRTRYAQPQCGTNLLFLGRGTVKGVDARRADAWPRGPYDYRYVRSCGRDLVRPVKNLGPGVNVRPGRESLLEAARCAWRRASR